MKRKLAVLFKELCCSQCRADFDDESFKIMREEDSMLVLKVICQECSKSFGVAFLGIADLNLKNYDEDDLVLKVQGEPEPISENDVLDAHKFIKDLDENWKKFIEKLDE